MHPFSVDFLTSAPTKTYRQNEVYPPRGSISPSELSGYSDGVRTPSPSSSISFGSTGNSGSPELNSTEFARPSGTSTPNAPIEKSSSVNNSMGSLSPSDNSHTSVNDPDVANALLALERQAALKPASGLEKPPLSYIALISMAILSSQEQKLLLSDIYQWIMDNFDYYNNEHKAWRNSIRHNLSLNECFIKAGRSDNGKGHFWAIHPACVQDFSRGDYRRRQARRRAKRNNIKEVESHAPTTVTQSQQAMMNYMAHAPSPIRFSPYALPRMYAAPYYAPPMSPLTPGLTAMPSMAPLSPTYAYPGFALSPAMMTSFPLTPATLKW